MRNQRAMSQTHFLPSCEFEASFKQKLSKEDCLPNYRLDMLCTKWWQPLNVRWVTVYQFNWFAPHLHWVCCKRGSIIWSVPQHMLGKMLGKKTAQEYAVGPVSNSNLHNVRTFNHTTPRRLDVLGDRTGVPFLFELFGGLREFPWVLSLRFVCETVFMLG